MYPRDLYVYVPSRLALAGSDICTPSAFLILSPQKLQKVATFEFNSKFQLFLSVEFLCNYHAIWAEKLEIMQ